MYTQGILFFWRHLGWFFTYVINPIKVNLIYFTISWTPQLESINRILCSPLLKLAKKKIQNYLSQYTSANRTFPTPCNNEIFSGKIAIGYIHTSHRKPVPPRYYTNISFDGVATVYSSILKILFSSLYSWFASHCFQLLADFSFCNSFATLKKKIFTILDHGVSSLWSESSRTGRCLHLIVNTALPQPPLY